ncbi:MAG: chalcone isomerase family protein [Methylophaga sp.]|nr:chalcone isomerase family protein [Methylophaga sp.]
MRKLIAFISLVFLSFSVSAIELGGIDMPDTMQADGQELLLNGAGIRSKFVFDLYVAGLYLGVKETDAAKIIASTEPMILRLHIISSKITSKKMTNATRSGFKKATGGKIEPISSEIEQFLKAFSDKIEVGDIFDIVANEQGVVISKNSVQQQTISSQQFKQALFGIWLSDKPVKAKLKKALLGN